MFDLLPIANRDEERASGGVQIQNVWAFAREPDGRISPQQFSEWNPDLVLIDPRWAFWRSLEAEVKLNVQMELDSFASILHSLGMKHASEFAFGPLSSSVSFERHQLLRCGERELFVVKLGKKNWRQRVAMKVKQTTGEDSSGILSRSMRIEAWSEETFRSLVSEFKGEDPAPVTIRHLPSFYKRKLRAVALHRKEGIVFGVSLDHSKVTGRSETLSQVETEYWSLLVPVGPAAVEPVEARARKVQATQLLLSELIEDELQRRAIPVARTQMTKSEWVSGVAR